MKEKPIISIVTPVYNSFELMGNYFSSLEAQTSKDFEVVLIDDCSCDDSYKNLLEFAQTSQLNIHVEKLESNSGPGVARNRGLELSQGEWVTFIDNDDWVTLDFIEKLLDVAVDKSIGSVVFDYYTKSDKRASVSHSLYYGEEGVIGINDAIIAVRNHTWGKAYNLNKLRTANIKFPPLRTAEDMAFVSQALVACQSVYYLQQPLYYYYQRNNSISNKSRFGVNNTMKAYEVLQESIGKDYDKELKEKSVVDKLYCGVKTLCNESYSSHDIRNYINNYCSYYPEWWNAPIVKRIGKAKQLFLLFVKWRFVFMARLMAGFHRFLINHQL